MVVASISSSASYAEVQSRSAASGQDRAANLFTPAVQRGAVDIGRVDAAVDAALLHGKTVQGSLELKAPVHPTMANPEVRLTAVT